MIFIDSVTSALTDHQWSYDYANCLSSADNLGDDALDQSFSYDDGGDMLSNSAVGAYAYPAATAPRPHTPTQAGAETLQYDANGNMTRGLGGKVMAYDGENRPVSVTHAGQTTRYEYGADGKPPKAAAAIRMRFRRRR